MIKFFINYIEKFVFSYLYKKIKICYNPFTKLKIVIKLTGRNANE